MTEGTLVRAVFPGKVISVMADTKIGKVILIEHDHDCATLYGRLGETGVKAGQEVVQARLSVLPQIHSFTFNSGRGSAWLTPFYGFSSKINKLIGWCQAPTFLFISL